MDKNFVGESGIRDAQVLAFKYEEEGIGACEHHSHEDHEHHHHHHHHHDHGPDCDCGCHDHDHEGHQHHHHHHDHGPDCDCGCHDHDHEGHHHHHNHGPRHDHYHKSIEITEHDGTVIATIWLGSLGRDKKAAETTLKSFMRSIAEETEGSGGMIGHIKFILRECAARMYSMTDLEDINTTLSEDLDYSAEGVAIVLGMDPKALEKIVHSHYPEHK